MGWITEEQLRAVLNPEFADLVFSLLPGEVGGPVLTLQGFHVVKVYDIQEIEVPEIALLQRRQEAFQLYMTNLRAESDIDTDPNWQRFLPQP